MKPFELISFPNSVALAQAAATAWLESIEAANQRQQPQYVALSGGRIAKDFFAAAAELTGKRKTSLTNVHFFWADERCVPPTDAESNFASADQLLFQPLHLASDHIHRLRGEDAPAAAVAQAEAEIRSVVPRDASGQPVLDIIFLGMGEDGHVASLFPGELAEISQSSAIYRAVSAAKPPPLRITMSYAAIASAREVWVLASGHGKEQALKNSLTSAAQTPLACVLKSRRHTRILSDVQGT